MPTCATNTYDNELDSSYLGVGDWYDYPNTEFSIKVIGVYGDCPCSECIPCQGSPKNPNFSWELYKNSRATFIMSGTYCSDKANNTNQCCIRGGSMDCTYDYGPKATFYLSWSCQTYNDVYVNTSTGSNGNCGCASTIPKQTFNGAYSVLNAGGTIHVLNNGANFTSETITKNKSFSIDTNGQSGNYFYLPKD